MFFINNILLKQSVLDFMSFKTLKIILKIHQKTRPTHRRTDTQLYPPERQLTKVSEPKERPKVKSDHNRKFEAHDFL